MNKAQWLDLPGNAKLLRRVFVGVLVLTVAAEALVSLHPHFAIESVFGFYAWFGFAACVAIILIAMALGVLLKRPDTYYDNGAPRDD